ncbi:uncharacterized protein LOC124305634 [Neodiprion virginianus]|uniref:uncharacterized protein LOC124305634 n=1 Tax=Neodiprion virginianus TaxID=2961670 RepID=UPI001EE69C16|nr:uncharacterized protein LOC124305634 [Neodiprion virginianus]
MCTWDAVGAPGAISQRLAKEGVVADRPGLRVKSVPLPDLCGVLRVNVRPRNLGSLAKVPGNHMSKVGEPLLAADWSQSGSQTSDPGRMCGGLPGQYFLIPDVRMDTTIFDQQNKPKQGGGGEDREIRGRPIVRGISWPPLTAKTGADSVVETPAVKAPGKEGKGETTTMAPADKQPPQPPCQQGSKRKGSELTPPGVASSTDDEELTMPRRPVSTRGGIPGAVESGTGETKDAPSANESGEGQQQHPKKSTGTRPKDKKRRVVLNNKGAYAAGGSDTDDSASEEVTHSQRPGMAKPPPTATKARGKATGTGTSSPEDTPTGIGPAEYRHMTAADLGAQIRDWIEEIDGIRVRCKSMNGRMSGEIKRRVGWAKNALLTLTGKAEMAAGPAELLEEKRRLEIQVRDGMREREKLQRKLEEYRVALGRAQAGAKTPVVDTYATVTRGTPPTMLSLDIQAAAVGTAVDTSEGQPTATSTGASDLGLRFTDSELYLVPDEDRARSEELARQAAALRQVREEVNRISRMLSGTRDGGSPNLSLTATTPGVARGRGAGLEPPSKASAVPNAVRETAKPVEEAPGAADSPMETGDDTWVEVRRKGATAKVKRKKKEERLTAGTPPGGANHSGSATEARLRVRPATQAQTGASKPPGVTRKAPRTAAVAIKCRGESSRYAEILQFARSKIQLEELDIGGTRVRRAANGGVLIEIPGPENAKKADALAERLSNIIGEKYGDAVQVTRPSTKGELRVQGLDDSVTTEELARTLAEQGGCGPQEIRVGPPRRMAGGLFSAWVQCPLRAATTVAAKGKFKIGWTIARVELLEARPRQCYRCWGFGHIGTSCNAPAARGRACFRCGSEGHQARSCTSAPKCVVCDTKGRNSAHRMGSGRCASGNLNHSRGAQDLLSQFALEEGVDVCLISEPHSIPGADGWLGSEDGLAAIRWRTEGDAPRCSLLERGRGYVAASCGKLAIVSVYISPNVPMQAFEAFMDDLDRVVRSAGDGGRGVLVGGDFNARSPTWDPTGSNRRGELLERWAASCGISLHNDGCTATCVRAQGYSVVDLTWSTPNLTPMVQQWRVLTETETLSDHLYIVYEVRVPRRVRSVAGGGHARWNWRKFKTECFRESLETCLAWGPTGEDQTTSAGLAAWVERAMTQACDAAAPRARPKSCRRTTHWWNEDLTEQRRRCVAARRRLTRNRRAASGPHHDAEAEYRASKRRLRDGIKAAKAKAWEDLVGSVEADPWGLPYKLVLGRLRTATRGLTETLDSQTLGRLLTALFPRGEGSAPISQEDRSWNEGWAVTIEEVQSAFKKGSGRSTAPGPDGVRGAAWAGVPEGMTTLIAKMFTACLREGHVPRTWKRARLVLIPKGGTSGGPLPKVRPICLLGELGKAFERILVSRLGDWMEENPRARLSDDQYGFRKGRSTIDALIRVREFVEGATRMGGCAVAVSLDIANAFNSLPWPVITSALATKGVPAYIRHVINNYLCHRYVEYVTEGGGVSSLAVTAGVPQGSVLGPLLWIMSFDQVLRVGAEPDTAVVCYADDTLVLSAAADPASAVALANVMVARVCRSITGLGLRISADKTEAVLFGRAGKGMVGHTPDVRVGSQRIPLAGSMKYLGVWLDSGLTFRVHFAAMEAKVGGITRALSRLMPNLRGPSEAKRRLYAGTLFAVILYGAPVWGDVAEGSRPIQRAMGKFQRKICTRVVAAYRTASMVSVTLLARTTPLHLVAGAYRRAYGWMREVRAITGGYSAEEAKAVRARELLAARECWRRSLEGPDLPSGRLRAAIVGNWDEWHGRGHGRLTFRLTQVLTGHGCFADFLHRIGRAERPDCQHCGGAADTASHTVETCPAWAEDRAALREAVGGDLTLPGLVRAMSSSREGWAAVARFAERVIAAKEIQERARQQQASQRGGNETR